MLKLVLVIYTTFLFLFSVLEFAYNQAPVAMKGLLTGLFLAASGIGNWVSTAILVIVEKATEDRKSFGSAADRVVRTVARVD